MFLIYGGHEELIVKGYVDASFNTDMDDSKSQSGYVFVLNGAAVSWRSSKQSVIAALQQKRTMLRLRRQCRKEFG